MKTNKLLECQFYFICLSEPKTSATDDMITTTTTHLAALKVNFKSLNTRLKMRTRIAFIIFMTFVLLIKYLTNFV